LNTPLVSIIIPVFNSDEYIADAINSALSQTWANIEIIIVDDGSTDQSLNIARNFKDDRLRIFEQKNKGASAARNKGLTEAKGDYIQFLDADDVLNSIKVEAQVRLLVGKDDAIANCATVNFFDKTDPYSIQPFHDWYREGSTDTVDFLVKLYGGALIGPEYGGMIGVHAWLCPKTIIDRAGRWNEELTNDDDGEFFCRVVLAARQIVYSDVAICYYRKYTRTKSLSAVNDYRANQSLLRATDLKAKYLLEKASGTNAKLALARLYHENAVSFYPASLALAGESERKMKQLIPDFNINPFKSGITGRLSKLISWKGVKILQYLKNRLFS
jgi:glycosyltransferase involved in cell wall biosynthesis